MRNSLFLTVDFIDDAKRNNYIIPQRNEDEQAAINSWKIEKPGFVFINRVIPKEELMLSKDIRVNTLYLTCEFLDPDGELMTFVINAGNFDDDSSYEMKIDISGEDGFIAFPTFSHASSASLETIFAIQKPIIKLIGLTAKSGKQYNIYLSTIAIK